MIDSLTIATIDTETVGLEGHVYDIAWCIHNKRGDIRIERNFLVEENFTDPAKMMGAFYAGKHFTHYARMLQDGEVRLTPWAEIVATMRADFLVHGVNVVAAYNAGFDFRVLAQTHSELAAWGKMLTDAVKVLDIWQFACETKLSRKHTPTSLALWVGFLRLAISRPAQNLPIAIVLAIIHSLRIIRRYPMRELRSRFWRNVSARKSAFPMVWLMPTLENRKPKRGR